MADDDWDEFEYEYEYSDNDSGSENKSDDTLPESSSSEGSPVDRAKPAGSNAPPSPSTSGAWQTRKKLTWETRNGSYGCATISPEELPPIMTKRSSDISEALGLQTSAAIALLCQHKWNTQRVLESFMIDSSRTLAKAGVTHRCSPFPLSSTTASRECSICMEPILKASDSLRMPCGHAFCLDCWGDYLTNAIQYEGATCMYATCPEACCDEVVTELEIQKAAPHLLTRYQQYRLRHFIESNGRYCPGKDCDRVVLASRDSVADCGKCGTLFCTECGEEPHAPADCATLKNWKDKDSAESQTMNWITVNTKNCPKCSSRIEKNGGCMHITCQNCRHRFCWVCMGTHHVWTCNAYKEPEDDRKLSAKSELERYLHYYNRYKGHADAQIFAQKQAGKENARHKKFHSSINATKQTRIGKKREEIEKDSDADSVDLPDFLKEANQELVAKECFEFHQGTLEGLTEGLSKATEKRLDEINQEDVVNRATAIGKFINNVLSHVDGGMDD